MAVAACAATLFWAAASASYIARSGAGGPSTGRVLTPDETADRKGGTACPGMSPYAPIRRMLVGFLLILAGILVVRVGLLCLGALLGA